MVVLRIAKDLALPLDAVTQAIAILARKGAGKTYTASVLVEEVVRAKVPVVILDPTGGWWGLRSSVDGERPGLPVVIFGGDHGDVPLEPTAGAVIADVVVEHPGAYVLDLSAFTSKAAEQRFAGDFLERLYRAKKRETGPLLLVVDEADVFAPQRPGPDQTKTLGALESIVRRGRIKGLGDLLITQRAAVLNKNVLTQTEVLIVMQTTGPQDRAAIDAWIEGNGTREERDEVLGSLASLERGEAWVWSPSFLRILQRVRIRARTTFDSSRTPEAGETAVAPRAFAAVDLAKLGARIAATVEQSKANDPAALKKRIRELEAAAMSPVAPEVRIERVEVPVLNGQVGDVRDAVRDLREQGEVLGGFADAIVLASINIVAAIDRVTTQGGPSTAAAPSSVRSSLPAARQPAVEASLRPAPRPPVATAIVMPGSGPSTDEVRLKAGARRMLSALAQLHPRALTKTQVATLAGVQRGGTFSDYLRSIDQAGYIEQDGDTMSLTAAGVAFVGDELGTGAPSPEQLVAIYAPRLKAGARRMLAELMARHPAGLTKAELGELAGVARGGTFSDYLRSLVRTGLARESGSTVYAGEDLYLG